MPRKTYYRRRRRTRRGGGFSEGYKTVAKYTNWATLWGAIKDIKSLINVESKFCDTNFATTAVNTTGGIQWISSISEGSDYNNRDGLSVKAANMFLRGTVTVATTPTNYAQNLRFIVFIDKESVGTPTTTDLLESPTNYVSPLNHTNGKRFQILWDKVYDVQVTGSSGRVIKLWRKLGHHIKWLNTTTGVKQGHIYVAYLSDGNAAGVNPNLTFYSRIRYIDN